MTHLMHSSSANADASCAERNPTREYAVFSLAKDYKPGQATVHHLCVQLSYNGMQEQVSRISIRSLEENSLRL